MKTLTELKAIAKLNILEAELIYRFGDEIPERLKGWRKIIGSNSVGIFLETSEGKKSELDLKTASLVEYGENLLTIYEAGERELDESEKALLGRWEAITKTDDYIKQSELDMLTDGSTTYYKKKSFFDNAKYMLGYDFHEGKKFNHNTSKMIDRKIKGRMILQYRLRRKGE